MLQLAEKPLSVTQPILFHYTDKPEEYQTMGTSTFKSFDEGSLILPEPQGIPLGNVALAHDQLEAGQGRGSLYLVP